MVSIPLYFHLHCHVFMVNADTYSPAFLGLTAIISDGERNARLSKDAEKSKQGLLEKIDPNKKAPTKKRGYPVWFSS